MELWKSTDQIIIRLDNQDKHSNLGRYQLYESNLLTGMKFIFRSMLDEKGTARERGGWMDQKDESNILTFIGDRGAGKTTAMKEFCRVLKNMNGSQGKAVLDEWLEKVKDFEAMKKLRGSSVRFHILKLIDAGLLNESEDLLEMILINLYQTYRDEIMDQTSHMSGYQTNAMEIERLFEELLEMYSSMGRKDGSSGEHTLATLSRMTGSGAMMREKISQLLAYMRGIQKQKVDYEFYVIAIDDLDLNLGNGYTMLEQLQKYFSDEQMIILLTMDYEQLCGVCMEHFHRAMEFTDKLSEDTALSHSQMLATDMMTKLFPFDQRIFLPDARKQGKQMRVLSQTGGTGLPVKKFIMEKVAECMHIFYDADGQKRHFCEPDTVREFVFYNDFLNSMYHVNYKMLKPWQALGTEKDEDLEEEAEIIGRSEIKERGQQRQINFEQLAMYDQNHHRFNDDIAKRQAQTSLGLTQRQFFKTLLGFDLSRRALYFERAEHDYGDSIEFRDVSVEERNDRSYADFLKKVYTLGREHYEDKPLICCILASFTSEMVREYFNFRYQPETESREKSRERLTRFLGRTVSNSWLIKNESFFTDSAADRTRKIIKSNRAELKNREMREETESTDDTNVAKEDEGFAVVNEQEAESAADAGILGFDPSSENPWWDSAFDGRGSTDDDKWKYIRMKSTSICFDLRMPEKIKETISEGKTAETALDEMLNSWFEQEKVVETLECVDMFLISQQNDQDLNYNGADMAFSVDTTTTGDYEGEESHACVRTGFFGNCIVDFFGFIPKSLDYEKRERDIARKIKENLTDIFANYLKDSALNVGKEKIGEKISEIVDKNSIFDRGKMSLGSYEVAFPFYDVDLAYNVLKRFRGRTSDPADRNLFDYEIEIFDILERLLAEEDREYKGIKFPYLEIFKDCPYVTTLRSFLGEDKKVRRRISRCLGGMCGQSLLESPEDTSV